MKDTIKQQITLCDWQALIPSFVRGVVIVIDPHLDLTDAAFAVAKDDAASVKVWMENGQIQNATDEDHITWLAKPEQKFQMVIVSPYVLIQTVSALN